MRPQSARGHLARTALKPPTPGTCMPTTPHTSHIQPYTPTTCALGGHRAKAGTEPCVWAPRTSGRAHAHPAAGSPPQKKQTPHSIQARGVRRAGRGGYPRPLGTPGCGGTDGGGTHGHTQPPPHPPPRTQGGRARSPAHTLPAQPHASRRTRTDGETDGRTERRMDGRTGSRGSRTGGSGRAGAPCALAVGGRRSPLYRPGDGEGRGSLICLNAITPAFIVPAP